MFHISKTTQGYLFVTLAALMWASSGTVGKKLFESGITPFELVQIRVTLSSFLLLTIFFIFRPHLLLVRTRDLPSLVLLGSVIMALVQVTYFFAISKIQVVAAILLQYLSPMMVAVYSMIFWKEKCTFWKIVALAFAVIGCYLVVGAYNLNLLQMNKLGIISGLAAAVCYGIYALLGEKAMHSYHPWTVVFYSLFFAAITWHIIYEPFHYVRNPFRADQWLWIIYIAVVGTIFPFGLYFLGINYLRATNAMITATLEPISAGVMAYFVLGESLELLQILGAVFVLSAIVILQFQGDQSDMSPDSIRNKGIAT